jgi:hypothetical protein
MELDDGQAKTLKGPEVRRQRILCSWMWQEEAAPSGVSVETVETGEGQRRRLERLLAKLLVEHHREIPFEEALSKAVDHGIDKDGFVQHLLDPYPRGRPCLAGTRSAQVHLESWLSPGYRRKDQRGINGRIYGS